MKFIDTHTHHQERSGFSLYNFRLGKTNFSTDKFGSVGIHPWDVTEDNNLAIKELYKLANKNNVLAIGETGLDRAIATSLKLQQEVFEHHIVVSELVRKPLIIHCVRAYNEILRIRRQNTCHQSWVFHGFHASEGMIHQLLKVSEFYFSFGKSLMSPHGAHVLGLIPLERVLLETDESPLLIEELYQRAAQIKKVDLQKLAEQIKVNFSTAFHFSIP